MYLHSLSYILSVTTGTKGSNYEKVIFSKTLFKKKTNESLKIYKKHKNFYSKLYKKEWEKYFDTLEIKRVSDNKAFWKIIQPLFSEKRKFANKMTLKDSEKNILSDDTLE